MTLGNANWHVSPINNVRMDKSVKMDYALKGVLIIRIVLDKMFASKADVSILAPLVKLVVPTVNVRLETKPSTVAVLKDLLVFQLPFKDVSGFPIPVLEKIVQRVTDVSMDSACGNVNFMLIVLEENNVLMACA